jgi:hypothetical protein
VAVEVKLGRVLQQSYFPACANRGYRRSLCTVTSNRELYSKQTVKVMVINFRLETSQHEKWTTTCVTVIKRFIFFLQDLTCIQITCKSLFTLQPGFETIHVLIRCARMSYFYGRSLLLIAVGDLLLDAFAWWGKTPISFIISVRWSASVSASTIGDFCFIWYEGCLWKFVERDSKFSQNPEKWHFAWRPNVRSVVAGGIHLP